MKELKTDQLLIDKTFMENSLGLSKSLPSQKEDNQDKSPITDAEFRNQIAIICLDFFCSRQLKTIVESIDQNVIDRYLLAETIGRDERGQYRTKDILYVMKSKVFLFRIEYANLSKHKDQYNWFVKKVTSSEKISAPHLSQINLKNKYLKKYIREITFKDIYPDYLHTAVANYFFE